MQSADNYFIYACTTLTCWLAQHTSHISFTISCLFSGFQHTFLGIFFKLSNLSPGDPQQMQLLIHCRQCNRRQRSYLTHILPEYYRRALISRPIVDFEKNGNFLLRANENSNAFRILRKKNILAIKSLFNTKHKQQLCKNYMSAQEHCYSYFYY